MKAVPESGLLVADCSLHMLHKTESHFIYLLSGSGLWVIQCLTSDLRDINGDYYNLI